MLALATLDVIVSMDSRHRWLSYLSAKGYLEHLCDALLQDDSQLQSLLTAQPPPLRALYTFESKMVYYFRFLSRFVWGRCVGRVGTHAARPTSYVRNVPVVRYAVCFRAC